jgi:hypothetical protein
MWLACPASVTLTRDVPRPSSSYAREGTAAHSVAEMSLKGDIFLPDKITVEDTEVIVSRGMCVALNPYVSHVEALRARWSATVVLGTHGMVWGTLDCGVHVPLRQELHVVDLKFGRGHIVDPQAPQLKLYALALACFVDTDDFDTKVTLTICQPRVGGDPLRSHETTLGELFHWRTKTVVPAICRIAAGDITEVAGVHCRWCVRKNDCKAFARKHQALAADVFDDLP